MKISDLLAATITAITATLITTASAQVVWQENFDGQTGKGITGGTTPVTNMTGITKWSVETSVDFVSTNQNFSVISNRYVDVGVVFDANNVKDEVTWQSESIDISTNDFVMITVDLSEVGELAQGDYVRTYYSVDGESNTLFHENGDLVDDFTTAIAKQEAITGTNLIITIKADNGAKENHHRFDNITVTAHTPVSNQPPAIAVSPSGTSKSVIADSPITFDLIATEEYLDRNDNITLKMTTNPGNATFAETNGTTTLTGTFSWTPDTPGDYTAIFEASDKDGTNTVQVDIKVYPGKKTIWLEDFNDPAIDDKGAYGPSNTVDLAGVTNWTVDITNTTLADIDDYFKVKNNHFEAQDIDGEAVWYSTNIDISTYSTVSASVDLWEEGGLAGTEYIRVYSSINNGTEQLFSKNGDMTGDFDSITASTTNFSGNNLQVIIRCRNIYGTRRHHFDNIKVSTPIPSGLIMLVR